MVEVQRDTKETKVYVKLDVYGEGRYNIDTGVGFFDHMLEAFVNTLTLT